MKHELSHDSIARQVLDKASVDAKARRKVQNLVDYALKRYNDRNILLTQDELDQIRPFREIISFKKEESSLIHKSETTLKKAARRKRFITIVIILSLSILLLIAIFSWLRSLQTAQELEKQKETIQAANLNLTEKQDSLRNILDQLDFALADANAQRDTAKLRALQAEREKAEAIFQKNRAEKESQRAQIANLTSQAGDALTAILALKNQIASYQSLGNEYEFVIKQLQDSIKVKEFKGVSFCDEAILINAKNHVIYLRKAKIHFEASSYQKAIDVCTNGIRRAKEIIPIYKARGEYFDRLDRKKESLKDNDWLYRNDPKTANHNEYLSNIVRFHKDLEEYEKALTRIETVLNRSSYEGQHFWLKQKVDILETQLLILSPTHKDYSAKLDFVYQYYEDQLKQDPSNSAQIYYQLASFQNDINQTEDALKSLQEATKTASRSLSIQIIELKSKIQKETSNTQLADLYTREGDDAFKAFKFADAKYYYTLSYGVTPNAATRQLIANCEDQLQLSFQLPEDPLIKYQWPLQNDGGLFEGSGFKKKDADAKVIAAWEFMGSLGSQEIKIAIYDNGFDLSHQDLVDKVITPFDFWKNSDNISKGDKKFTNGTPVASIALASANKKGIVGIAPNAKFIPIQGTSFSSSTMEKAFQYSVDKKADILICPWGTIDKNYQLNNTKNEIIAKTVKDGRQGKGLIIIFPVGNSGVDYINFYADHPDVIAVGSSTSTDTYADYSNRGQNISLVAPSNGDWPVTAAKAYWDAGINAEKGIKRFWRDGKERDNRYKHFGGTVTSAAIVGGVCALMLSENPNLTAKEVKAILQRTADKIGAASDYDSKGFSPKYGYGRINALKAVQEARKSVFAN